MALEEALSVFLPAKQIIITRLVEQTRKQTAAKRLHNGA
jgi:hypothetical protein